MRDFANLECCQLKANNPEAAKLILQWVEAIIANYQILKRLIKRITTRQREHKTT